MRLSTFMLAFLLLGLACAASEPSKLPKVPAEMTNDSRTAVVAPAGASPVAHLRAAPYELPGSATPRGPADPVMLPPAEAWALLDVDTRQPPYALMLPPALRHPGMRLWGVFQICVGAKGTVSSVVAVKSADKLVDHDWMAGIRRWHYKPLARDGAPSPFCSETPLEIAVP